ncbi:MAG: LysE family transporter [Bacteroidales bacterium]|nr:LysE family transporter [Bacteroidales bacterium]
MSPLIQGMIVGLTFAVLLGPVFFSLIQTSIHRGFRSGVLLAAGIFIGDLGVMILCYLGASQILGEDPRENLTFGIIGGIILIIFGTYTFTRKVAVGSGQDPDRLRVNTPGPLIFILKGIFLNAANPGVWFIWITITVSVTANFGIHSPSVSFFLAGVLMTILLTDILKCFIAHHIKHFLNATVMTWMNRIVGLFLVFFGSYLLINVLFDLQSMIPGYNN